jgi:hypothetical protein
MFSLDVTTKVQAVLRVETALIAAAGVFVQDIGETKLV